MLGSCPQRVVKIAIGDMNARIEREEMYKPVTNDKRPAVNQFRNLPW